VLRYECGMLRVAVRQKFAAPPGNRATAAASLMMRGRKRRECGYGRSCGIFLCFLSETRTVNQ